MADAAIRAERPGDAAAVSQLLLEAFGGEEEARLVETLRADGELVLSLVAEAGGGIVGCVMFSPLVTPEAPGAALLALAPVAVAGPCRRQGLGARLIEEGLARLRAWGAGGVVVLGDPAYYRRFGFGAEAARGLACAWSGPYLQALTFSGARPAGALRYAAAFGEA